MTTMKSDCFKIVVLTSVFLATLSGCNSQQSSLQNVQKIHERALTVDSHIDWPFRQSLNPEFDPGIRHGPGNPESGQWDLIRMQEGGLDAVFMSIFTPQKERTPEGHQKAKELASQLIDLTEKMVLENSDLAEIALTPEDARRIESSGKLVDLGLNKATINQE